MKRIKMFLLTSMHYVAWLVACKIRLNRERNAPEATNQRAHDTTERHSDKSAGKTDAMVLAFVLVMGCFIPAFAPQNVESTRIAEA